LRVIIKKNREIFHGLFLPAALFFYSPSWHLQLPKQEMFRVLTALTDL
jgi:hypothetical protein